MSLCDTPTLKGLSWTLFFCQPSGRQAAPALVLSCVLYSFILSLEMIPVSPAVLISIYPLKSQLIGKDLDAGKDWRQKERRWKRIRQLDSISSLMDINLSKFWEIVKDREAWHAAVHVVTKNWTWLSDWVITNIRNSINTCTFHFKIQ